MLRTRLRMACTIALLATATLATVHASAETSPTADGVLGEEHSYTVWRGGERSLPGHTVLRPADLSIIRWRLPIVVWANGGCRPSNEEFHYFLTTLASRGVMILANGDPQVPYNTLDLTGLAHPQSQLQVDAITWAFKVNDDRRSPYFHRLDTHRILAMGQSCGGWESVDASSDSRVTSTIIWNSGANPYHPQGVFNLHAPVMFAHGGPIDHVAWDAIASYQLADVPAVLISNPNAGHTNWWDDPGNGMAAPSALQRVPGPIVAKWMEFTLYGSRSARSYFLGAQCGLCTQPGWTVRSKNWP